MPKTISVLLLLILIPGLIFGWADWKTVSNKHFKIYYKDHWETEAVKALKTLEYYRPTLENLTGNQKGQIPVTIEDLGNIVNGYTDPFSTRIALFAYPPTKDELAVCEDWWQLVACHEYVHMLQITNASGIPKLLRIGLSNYLYPQIHQPAWMTEGITVYGESRLSQYTGRLNSGTFPAIIKAIASENKLPTPTKASYYSFDTPHAQYYTFGGAFYSFLAQTYGEERFARLFDYMSSSLTAYLNPVFPYFNLDNAYKRTYGKTVEILWQEWIQSERDRKYTEPSTNLSSGGWFKSDLQADSSSYYYVAGKADKTGPGSSFFTYKLLRSNNKDYIASEIKAKKILNKEQENQADVLIEQSNDFPAGYNVQGNTLFYTRSEYRRGFANQELDGYGAIVELWQKDIRSGSKQRLYRGQFRAFFPLPDRNFLVSEDNENHTASTLIIYNPETKLKTVVLESDMLIHKILRYDDKLILGVKKQWQTSSIYQLNLERGELKPVIDTPFYETPVSVSGDTLVFSAVYDGNQSTYVHNLKTLLTYKFPLTYYMNSPVIKPDGNVRFISVNASGYDIYTDKWQLEPYQLRTDTEYDNSLRDYQLSDSSNAGMYFSGKGSAFLSNLAHMAVPRLLHTPFIIGKADSLSYGIILEGSDATGDLPFWSAKVYYDSYYETIKYSFSLDDPLFRPVRHTLTFSDQEEESISSNQLITLYRRMNYGLQNLAAGFSFITTDNYTRKQLTPYLQMFFSWSSGNLYNVQYVPYESKFFLASDRERFGWQSYLQAKQKLPLTSELRTSLQIALEPDANPDEVLYPIRGYLDGIYANEGMTISTSWYKPIIEIREGLWNPQVYLEDISFGLFFDTSFPFQGEDAESVYSAGMELVAELGLAYYLRLNGGARLSFRDDNVPRFEFFVDTLF